MNPVLQFGTSDCGCDATRVAKQYGSDAADWVKKSSTSFRASAGARIETHREESLKTMENRVEILRRIEELASEVLSGEIDPLTGAREIDARATSIGVGCEHPFVVLKGIVSQADDIPDVGQLQMWDSSSTAAKSEERQSLLQQFGNQILSACSEIQAMSSGRDG